MQPPSRKWKIFYADGSTFSSAEGAPQDSPGKPVAVITQQDGRCGRRILKFENWYRWDQSDGRWFECDAFDVLSHAALNGYVTARVGKYMPDDQFEKLLIKAHEDRFIEPVSPADPAHPAWRE